ncbi:MAG: hypothetical protein U0414_25665 [Polyangiaceae bacterium]
MTAELSRRLLALGVPRPELEAALFVSVVRGVAIARALVDRGVLTERVLEEDLSRAQGFALEHVTAAEELTLRVPPSMCRRLGAIPIRFDAFANTAEVAAIDAQDPHVQAEFAFHLGLDVRVVRATMSAIEAEIRRLELGDAGAAPVRVRRRTPAFPHGAPRSSIPPPPMEEVPIPLVRRVGGPPSARSSPGAIPAVQKEPRSSRRNPTPAQFSFGAAHVRSGSQPDPAETIPASVDWDADLDASTLALENRANGSRERASHLPTKGSDAPASVRHAPRLLGDGLASPGPAVSFPSTPPSSRRASELPAEPPPNEEPRPSPARDPALSAIAPQSLVPSTELAPPRLPTMALGPVSAHAVLEWGPASDAFARGIATSLSETDPPSLPAPEDTLAGVAPFATIRVAPEPAPFEEEPGGVEEPPMAERTADSDPTVAPPREWDERTDEHSTPGWQAEDFTRAPDSNTRFIERSPEDGLSEALDALSGALDRDELIATLLEVAGVVAERVGVFVVKKDGFHGWACNDAFGDVNALKGVRIPSAVPNILATATAAGFYLGPVPNTPGHQGLLAVMGSAGAEVSVNVATVATRPVLVLVSDGFGDTMRTTKVLGEMMRVAGLTLARLLQLR